MSILWRVSVECYFVSYSWSIKVIIVSKNFFIEFNIAKFVTFIPYRSLPSFPRKLRQMNTIRWYKIGKLLLRARWTREPCRRIRIIVLRSLRNKSTQAQKHSLNITDVLLKVYSRFSQVSPSKSSMQANWELVMMVVLNKPEVMNRRLRIYESHIFELRIKTWMKVILAVMCTT